jgi:hypothetical protein
MTETTSVEVVKWSRPSMPLSCCRHTTVAAPAMNPTIVACDRKSTMNPNLEAHTCMHNITIIISRQLESHYSHLKA